MKYGIKLCNWTYSTFEANSRDEAIKVFCKSKLNDTLYIVGNSSEDDPAQWEKIDLHKTNWAETLCEYVREDYVECEQWNDGVIYYNNNTVVYIGYGRSESGMGFYKSVLAIDPDDKICKEWVATGCYSYARHPFVEYENSRDITNSRRSPCIYFGSVAEAVRRYESDKKKIEERRGY